MFCNRKCYRFCENDLLNTVFTSSTHRARQVIRAYSSSEHLFPLSANGYVRAYQIPEHSVHLTRLVPTSLVNNEFTLALAARSS